MLLTIPPSCIMNPLAMHSWCTALESTLFLHEILIWHVEFDCLMIILPRNCRPDAILILAEKAYCIDTLVLMQAHWEICQEYRIMHEFLWRACTVSLDSHHLPCTGDSGSAEDSLTTKTQLAKTEVSLMLTNKYEVPEEDNHSDVKALLLSTKRLIIEVIRCQQSGENLREVLVIPASKEEVGLLPLFVRCTDPMLFILPPGRATWGAYPAQGSSWPEGLKEEPIGQTAVPCRRYEVGHTFSCPSLDKCTCISKLTLSLYYLLQTTHSGHQTEDFHTAWSVGAFRSCLSHRQLPSTGQQHCSSKISNGFLFLLLCKRGLLYKWFFSRTCETSATTDSGVVRKWFAWEAL